MDIPNGILSGTVKALRLFRLTPSFYEGLRENVLRLIGDETPKPEDDEVQYIEFADPL